MKYWIVGLCIVATGAPALAASAAPLNPELKIGIRQRVGQKAKAELLIQALPGDRLTVKFPSRDKVETLTTDKLQVSITPKPLTEPRIEERVVISTHRSFESAEASAAYWKAQGIEVEVAQPENWQVWAKRDRYDSTVSRLLLLQDLKSKGLKTGYLDRKTWTTRPTLNWVVNGYRYHRDEVDITSTRGVIQVDQKRYGGRLRFQPNTYGSYTLVNQVPLETYLRGVVPHEIGRQAPETAVQAQAILARTYALRNLRRFKIDNYELCADTQCQVYEGLNDTDAKADKAIVATRGQVLTHKNELIDALYSSTTGGVTAAFEDVWEGNPRPYLTAKIDAYPNQVWDLKTRSLSDEKAFRAFINLKQGFNEAGGYFRWRTEAPLAQLNQNFREFLKKQQHPLAGFSSIQNLTVAGRAGGGRVQRFRVTTEKGALDLTKDEILRAFDAPNSLLFYVDPIFQPDRKTLKGFAFVGGGLGHGVGLSQIGSYALSQGGWSAPQILSFYYPNTVLQPLSTQVSYWTEAPSPSSGSKTSLNGQTSGLSSASQGGSDQGGSDQGGIWILGWQFPSFQTIVNWFNSLGKPQSASLALKSPYLD
ncbi:MAG: SpoIID/LytB domain-containing protein [Thermosynechococcaceae cyanobacterium MS004]|nr:SpoIID/LytB domain-containing protein [Thermosynechococcaceae cyanobacterium MS004]